MHVWIQTLKPGLDVMNTPTARAATLDIHRDTPDNIETVMVERLVTLDRVPLDFDPLSWVEDIQTQMKNPLGELRQSSWT